MPLQLITPPDEEPVTVDEVRPQLELDLELFDEEIAGLIKAAREYVEKYCNRAIVTQTVELVLERFPAACDAPAVNNLKPVRPLEQFIELPRGRTVSVTSLKYRDGAGAEQTLVEGTDFLVDNVREPGRVHLAPEKSWPSTQRRWDAVRVRYVVGTSVDEVPKSIKQAIQMLVKQMWINDTPEVSGTIVAAVRTSFEALLAPHRIYSFGSGGP